MVENSSWLEFVQAEHSVLIFVTKDIDLIIVEIPSQWMDDCIP